MITKSPKIDPDDLRWWIKAMGIVFFVILMAHCFTGCYSPQKAFAGIERAISKYPVQSANQTRQHFPCTTTHKDSVITQTDTVLWINCPENPDSSAVDYTGKDTVVKTVIKNIPGKTVIKTVQVPVTLPIRTITVTEKVKDSAEIYAIQSQLNKVSEQALKAKWGESLWRKIAILFIVLFCLSWAFFILKNSLPKLHIPV